jgi:Tol biopolymer transport system component
MSPEQAEGKRLDRRSDIFSFGLVLYEMITGQPAFQRSNTVSTLAAILRDEPRSLRDTVGDMPPDLERVVNHCLRKDPARRFQHMDDVRVELQEIRDAADSGRFAVAPAVAVAGSGAPRWYGAVAAVVCLGVAGALWVWYSGDSRRNFRSEPLLKRLTSDAGLSFQPSLSPDGKLVAYSSDRSGDGGLDLWVQQLAGGEPVRLTRDPADDQDPTFSPDGSRIGFSSGRGGGGVYVMSTLGGAEEKLADGGFWPRFSPDGKWIAYRTGDRVAGTGGTGAVYVIPAKGGGTPHRVAESFMAAVAPVWSPDSKSILIFGANRVEQQDNLRHADWLVVRLDSGDVAKTGFLNELRDQHLAPAEYTTATQHLMPIASSWTNGYIYFSAFRGQTSNIFRLPVSLDGVRSTGPAERLTTGTALESDPSVATDGDTLIAFTSLSENVDLWSLPVLPDAAKITGELQRLTQNLGADVRPSISLDGNMLVYNSNPAGNWDVWLKDFRTGTERILASSEQDEENPRITSDGREVLYRVAREVFSIPAGGGIKRKIADDCRGLFPWSTLSRTFLCVDGSGLTLAHADLSRKTPIVRTIAYAARLSWDDRWVTFYNNVSGGYTRIYVAPVNTASPANERDLIPITSGKSWDALPEFSPDGGVLYFQSERDGRRCLWAQRLDKSTKRPIGEPFLVQHFHKAGLSLLHVTPGQRSITVARERIIITAAERTGNVWLAQFGTSARSGRRSR